MYLVLLLFFPIKISHHTLFKYKSTFFWQNVTCRFILNETALFCDFSSFAGTATTVIPKTANNL